MADVTPDASVARSINHSARKVGQQRGIEHPEIDADPAIGWIGWRPVRGAATFGTVPQIKRTIALPVRDAFSLNDQSVGRAIVP